MADIVNLIESKDLVSAKDAINEKIKIIYKTKILEMKKMAAAKMFGEGKEDVLKAAFDKIDKTFGPGGSHSDEAIKKRTAEYRAKHPGFNAFLKKHNLKNPYKKDE